MSIPYAEVIGDPIAHSKSPLIHRFWLEKLRMPGDYRKAHILPADLPAYFANRAADPDWRGCSVTIPHKQAVLPFVDACEDGARAIGAANCVYWGKGGLIAANTDVDGIGEALPGFTPGTAACLIGAGGAARAALASLKHLGASRVNIIARNAVPARTLLAAFDLAGDVFGFDQAEAAASGSGALVNASPLGMAGSPPLPASVLAAVDALAPGARVFDMVYAPLETALLGKARDAGFATTDGLVMLIGQAASAFALFFGASAPREHDAELRALLIA